MAICELCGEKLAGSNVGYRMHMKRFHSVLEQPRAFEAHSVVITPTRITNRSKAQIVHDMEKIWGAAIIPPVMPWHALGDR